ncbi:MAG: nucleotide exchange factor GrpE [Candidatus Zixiibacteriota bacterium]
MMKSFFSRGDKNMNEEQMKPDNTTEEECTESAKSENESAESPEEQSDAQASDKPVDEQVELPKIEERESESERYMRLAAEFDNYKKRTAREFGDLIKTANARLLRSLVEIADNFERAIQADDNGGNGESYKKGVELIYSQLMDLMKKENVTPIEAVGQPFDPNVHEALMQQPSAEYDEGIIVNEIQRGYKLEDKVLRHARVVVSSGQPQSEENNHE